MNNYKKKIYFKIFYSLKNNTKLNIPNSKNTYNIYYQTLKNNNI